MIGARTTGPRSLVPRRPGRLPGPRAYDYGAELSRRSAIFACNDRQAIGVYQAGLELATTLTVRESTAPPAGREGAG
ncbi:hypothetical protein [Nonomuraea sp. JJY05]|uniref:hypothetical protein n=1 Tax=Nonomuraea sp. JJY05 TaxID=3350255 RepID=UPI00373F42D2